MRVVRRTLRALGLALAAAALAASRPSAGADAPIVVDGFDNVSAWTAHPAEGVTLGLASDAGERGRALRMDVRFAKGTGYAVARRAVSLDLPDDYVFRLRLRGNVPNNTLEFKLVDSTGNNVWWHVRRNLEFPREWRTVNVRKRQIGFAWGPAGGGEIRHVAYLEIAVTAGEGGAGSVWLDDLMLEPLAADSTLPPVRARASSSAPGAEAARAVDGDRSMVWASAAGDSLPWLELDLGRPREFGGLDLRWTPGRHLADYVVALSLDGKTWTAADTVVGGDGGRDPLYLPESEARFVRITALRDVPAPVALHEATIQPLEWSATPEAYFTNLAKDAPRGTYPRPYYGEQCAWAVVGPDAGQEEALLSEDGMLETGKGQYSIEPFLRVGGRLISWADVKASQTLSWGRLPQPSVEWGFPGARLSVSAAARGDTAHPGVAALYTVVNASDAPQRLTLYLAVRPFQVNPPWQNVGFSGGTARIHTISRDGDRIRVGGSGFVCRTAPSRFGATTLSRAELVDMLRGDSFPGQPAASDPKGFASGVVAFDLELPPHGRKDVEILIPLRAGVLPSVPEAPSPGDRATSSTPPQPGIRRFDFALGGEEVSQTLFAQIGWILVNRDGGAIQPGSRSYDRSWIRDGSLTSSALLRVGHADVVKDFIEWFAPFQFENGKIPCCASDRGPDPVTENDSHGQFIWLIAEYYRYTGDRALVERMWPHVAAAVAHMDSLRGERRSAAWRAPDKRKFFGLLLPSISHEGYPNPMHSYWDDFFAYRGYVDAAYLAEVLGRSADRARYAAARDTFAHDLTSSIAAAMAEKGIDYVPGCAELGDFDATSTTVALAPTDAADLLPEAAVRRTFERYWEFFRDRRAGRLAWEGYTPYEMRVIGSFVRLGWRDRAYEALQWFMTQRTPPGWRQWAEVVHRDPRAPKYIGDMPHTWVGSDFMRSVLDMLAYERGRDRSIVIAAGVPWSAAQGRGVVVINLRTSAGLLSYSLRAEGDAVRVTLAPGLTVPPGGIVLAPPARRPFRAATINGTFAPITPEGGVIVRALPARVVMRP